MAIVIILLISGLVVWRWVIGMDYMHENHPDYKGEDLFGEGKELYPAIEAAIIRWNLDKTKTAGSLTREIMLIIKQQKDGTI